MPGYGRFLAMNVLAMHVVKKTESEFLTNRHACCRSGLENIIFATQFVFKQLGNLRN